jgi:hypothetical protein
MSPVLFMFNYMFIIGTASLNYCVRAYVKAVARMWWSLLYLHTTKEGLFSFLSHIMLH